ncbi:MAG TPA: DUF4412 domain-containing protein [Chitinophagaceae bacterium]|nr:DUF4412 domain-containing protein [Chitinophagaceae bacterium]
MRQLNFFSIIIFSGIIFFSCSSNSSSAVDKGTNDSSQNVSANQTSGGSGSDMFYEYNLTTSSNEMSIKSDSKIYISSKGDMRAEMDMINSFKGNTSLARFVTLGHADKPNESISVDDSAKTFSVNHFSDSSFNAGENVKTISVAKAGEEKISGYNSIHAKIITERSVGGFYSEVDTIDIWKSNDVPMLASVKELFDRFEAKTGNAMYSTDVVNQLKQMGCVGFMTKIEIHSKRSSTTEVLVKVEHRDLSASMFQVPAGYTETKE